MSWSRKQICQELKRIFNGQFLNIIGSDKPLNIQVLEDNENFDVYSLKSDWGKAGKDYKISSELSQRHRKHRDKI